MPGSNQTLAQTKVPPINVTPRSISLWNLRVIRLLVSCPSKHNKENIMPKEMHQKAAEHHEQAAKAHQNAATQHGSNDHVGGKQQSAQAAEKSKTAHEHSTQANNKSQQQK
jgi:hypothetical protein